MWFALVAEGQRERSDERHAPTLVEYAAAGSALIAVGSCGWDVFELLALEACAGALDRAAFLLSRGRWPLVALADHAYARAAELGTRAAHGRSSLAAALARRGDTLSTAQAAIDVHSLLMVALGAEVEERAWRFIQVAAQLVADEGFRNAPLETLRRDTFNGGAL